MQNLCNSYRFIFPPLSFYVSWTPFIYISWVLSLFHCLIRSLMCSLITADLIILGLFSPFPLLQLCLTIWCLRSDISIHWKENEYILHLIYIPHNNLSQSILCEGSAVLQVWCSAGFPGLGMLQGPLLLWDYKVILYIVLSLQHDCWASSFMAVNRPNLWTTTWQYVRVYDLYCSRPPGGDRDVFASILGAVSHQSLYRLQSIIYDKLFNWIRENSLVKQTKVIWIYPLGAFISVDNFTAATSVAQLKILD